MRLKRTKQCALCPWRKEVNPNDIPNGYSRDKHRALAKTIAKEGDTSFLSSDKIHIMACHETDDAHCIGWLMNQLGAGNNIALRIQMRECDNLGDVELRGEQHETFDETLGLIG